LNMFPLRRHSGGTYPVTVDGCGRVVQPYRDLPLPLTAASRSTARHCWAIRIRERQSNTRVDHLHHSPNPVNNDTACTQPVPTPLSDRLLNGDGAADTTRSRRACVNTVELCECGLLLLAAIATTDNRHR